MSQEEIEIYWRLRREGMEYIVSENGMYLYSLASIGLRITALRDFRMMSHAEITAFLQETP